MTNEDFLREYGDIPTCTLQAIQRHVRDACPVGDFLYTVLTNNLSAAVGHADEGNLNALPQIVKFLHNHTPALCWGTKARVKDWPNRAREESWQNYVNDYWPEDSLWPQRRI